MIINKNKNKKGFTLIELIAVIAILAILGAILVPRISGYSESAKKSKAIADAKILVNAVAAYNADLADGIAEIEEDATIETGIKVLIGAGKVIESAPKEFDEDTTLTQLKAIAAASKDDIEIDSNGMVTVD